MKRKLSKKSRRKLSEETAEEALENSGSEEPVEYETEVVETIRLDPDEDVFEGVAEEIMM